MATNEEIEKQVGPKTFTRPPYSVTIAADGKIHVHKDDWLSKYSWALYGDYDTLDVFVRGNPKIFSAIQKIEGIQEIENKDLIDTGEYLIHVPTYFHWMEKNGKPQPKKPKKEAPLKPEEIRTFNWRAANLGPVEISYFASVGADMLMFHNLDTGTNYYHLLLRSGVGFEIGLGAIADLGKLVIKALRAAGVALWLIKAATANYVPVTAHLPFSAKSLEHLDIACICWTIKSGVGGHLNRSYEEVHGSLRRRDHFDVTFIQDTWIDIPEASFSITTGGLFWVW